MRRLHIAWRDAKHIHVWHENEHPRGKPKNEGQFVEKKGGAKTSPTKPVKLGRAAIKMLENWMLPPDDEEDENTSRYSPLVKSKHFAQLLRTLPQYTGTVWRGAGLATLPKPGKVLTFTGNTPTSKNAEWASSFASYESKPVIYRLDNATGADLDQVAANNEIPQSENEVTIPMGARFCVTDIIVPKKQGDPPVIVCKSVK